MAIYKNDIVDINLESGSIHRSFLNHTIGTGDNIANHFGVRAFRNGEPVNLEGGSVQGYFRDPRGNNIAITSGNIVSGNTAVVVLPQACYNYEGQFCLAIKLISDGVTGTVRIVDGMVDNTHTGGAVAPTETVPTYQEVLAVYDQMVAAKEGSVRFDITQELTDTQEAKARENIGAASDADLTAEETARQNADSTINGKIGNTTLPTTAQTLTGAIAEHETDITGINGKIGNTALPTTAQTLTGAIGEHETKITGLNSALYDLRTDIALEYDSSSTYDKGDYVSYNGNFYRAKQDIETAEAWTSGHWTLVAIGNDIDLQAKVREARLEVAISNEVVNRINADDELKSALSQEVSVLYNSFSDFGDKYDLDQIIEGTGYLSTAYKYIIGLIPGNSIVKPVQIVTRNNASATYVKLEIWKRTAGTNNFTKDSEITGKVVGMVGNLYKLEFDYFYTAEEILLVIADSTSGGYISQTAATGYNMGRFNKSTTTLDLASAGHVNDVKVSYAWGYINIAMTEDVDDLKNAVNTIAIKFDKTNQSSVSTLAATKRWICRFIKAGTFVKSFTLQIAAESMEYVSAELWQTSDGTTYTRASQLIPVSVKAMTNQYKLTFPAFTAEKDGFICTFDTASTGQARYTTLTGNTVLYFNKTDSTITIAGMSSLSNAVVCYSIEMYEPQANEKKPVIVRPDGSGTYKTILEAMQTEPEGTPIYVYPGIYDQDMTACLKKRVILIGTDRNQCIIRDTDGRYGHHPLYVSCGYFENLTIECPYVSGTSQEIGTDSGSYAVHIDADDDYGIGKQIEFHHCNISSDFFPAVGCGLRKNLTFILDDCILTNGQISGRGKYANTGTLGALYFHDSNGEQGDQYAIIKGCVMKSKLAYAMCIYQVDRETQNNRVYCDFINNVLFSETGHYTDTVYLRNDPFNENTGIFSIRIGYGNSIALLNN